MKHLLIIISFLSINSYADCVTKIKLLSSCEDAYLLALECALYESDSEVSLYNSAIDVCKNQLAKSKQKFNTELKSYEYSYGSLDKELNEDLISGCKLDKYLDYVHEISVKTR